MTSHQSLEDAERYKAFVRAVAAFIRAMAGYVPGRAAPNAKPLLRARKGLRNRVLPRDQQFAGSPMVQLIGLAEAIDGQDLAERADTALKMGGLVAQIMVGDPAYDGLFAGKIETSQRPATRARRDLDD